VTSASYSFSNITIHVTKQTSQSAQLFLKAIKAFPMLYLSGKNASSKIPFFMLCLLHTHHQANNYTVKKFSENI
jgi:hypothetical protein